jgi:thiamine pyrophosphate-dependent acetolactate synthase large subunit-like protein
MITSTDAAKAINYHRNDAVVVSTSQTLKEWQHISQRRDLDIDLVDCMDRAPAVGLGVSLALDHKKVIVLDCDSTLRTDIGSLTTVAESEPENFIHFVFNDQSFYSTGGTPIQGSQKTDFATMALGAGYKKAYNYSNTEDLLLGMETIMNEAGPVLVVLNVVFNGDTEQFPNQEKPESWERVKRSLESNS